jgi:hypothetical protein
MNGCSRCCVASYVILFASLPCLARTTSKTDNPSKCLLTIRVHNLAQVSSGCAMLFLRIPRIEAYTVACLTGESPVSGIGCLPE